MFWGLILKPNKKYSHTMEKSFHISQAALDYTSSDDNEPVQVMCIHEDCSYLLCTLKNKKKLQCQLDLNFKEGEKVCFSTTGSGIVHLTGYLIDEEDEDFEDVEEEESEEDTEEDNEVVRKKFVEDLRQKIQKKMDKNGKPGKKKAEVVEEEKDSDEEESDNDEHELDETKQQESEDYDEEDDDEEQDSEDGSSEEKDSSDDEASPPPAKQQKIEPKPQQKQQNVVNPKNQKQNESENEPGRIQKLKGGLVMQDLKAGQGATAKFGKKVQVYYEGRLKSNNKVFDATKSGPGFKFMLGRGEVIKGWDIGLNGMKVGGKRRLVIPPGLAYGPKGQPPVIPQNATLIFDVELKNVF